MPCPCGSTDCSCEQDCFCRRITCYCSKCGPLAKKCPYCRLFYYAALSLEDLESMFTHKFCTCDRKASSSQSEAKSNFQTTESKGSCASSAVPVSEDRCSRCNLLVPLDPLDETYERDDRYCGCPLGELIPDYPEIQSEHETSNSSSDHRQVSADRQTRKAQSRKTRKEKSNWHAKKVRDRTSNLAEDSSSSNTVIVDGDSLLDEASNPRVESQDEKSNVTGLIPGGVTDDQNLNPDVNEPQRRFSSRAEILAGSGSGQADSSVFPGPFFTAVTDVGFNQLNSNVRSELPPPSSALQRPIQDPSAFEGQMHESRIRSRRSPRPFIPEEAAVSGEVKVKIYFESVQNELKTSGKIPDAETAAKLDRMDKEQLCPEVSTPSDPVAASDFVEASDPPAANEDDDKDDIEPTTDTDRSTTISKSHKESESD